MAHAVTKLEWTLTLTNYEFNVILRALGGRLPPNEIEKAMELGRDLSQIKVKEATHRIREIGKLERNLAEYMADGQHRHNGTSI